MAAVDVANGFSGFSDSLVTAVARNAAFVAELTAATLDASGLFVADSIPRLPRGFLLELAAVLQLGLWERQGIVIHQQAGLPSFASAAKSLALRAKEGPTAFSSNEATVLSRSVLVCWIEHFAWDSSSIWGCEMIVGDADEDEFADMLAEFLWDNRDHLSQFLELEENPHVE